MLRRLPQIARLHRKNTGRACFRCDASLVVQAARFSPGALAAAALLVLAALLSGCGNSESDSNRGSGSGGQAGAGAFVADGPRSGAILWAAGDGADGGPGAEAVAELVRHRRPDLFLYLGDVYPEGDADGYAHSYA